eukprot:PITA_35330
MALAWIPRGILVRLRQICCRYLWNGKQDKRVFALISWDNISMPKKWGGWGLKDLTHFAHALAAKFGWTLLTRQNIWTTISYHNNLTWRINDGSRAHIGMDPWTGGGRRCYLPPELVQILEQQNTRVIAYIADQENSSIFTQAWKSAAHLNLPPEWHQYWEDYTNALSESHIPIKDGPDELMWDKAES